MAFLDLFGVISKAFLNALCAKVQVSQNILVLRTQFYGSCILLKDLYNSGLELDHRKLWEINAAQLISFLSHYVDIGRKNNENKQQYI